MFQLSVIKGVITDIKENDATDNVIKARAIVRSGGAKILYSIPSNNK